MLNTTMSIANTIDYELGDHLTLTSVTAYREGVRETRTANFSRRMVVGARTENQESESSQFSQELRLDYSGDRVDVIVGGMFSKYNLETTPINDAIGFSGQSVGNRTGFSVCHNLGFFCLVPVDLTYENTKNTIVAVFTDATFKLNDQFDLFGGLRFSDYKNTTGVGIDTLSAQRVQRIADNNLSGRIGLSYKPHSGANFYGSYARGYKPPAIVVPTVATSPTTLLKPELADAFEVGAKLALGRLQFSANAFYTKVKNFQTQYQTFQGVALVSVTQNIESVTSKGFELGLMGQVNKHLSINAGYQFNDVRFPKNFVGNDSIDLSNTQFLNAPKHKFTLSGEYSTAVTSGVDFFLNANAVYKSSVLLAQYGNPAYRFPAHALINGGFGLRDADGRWTASVFARNLTKQREPIAYLAGDYQNSADGSIRAWPAAGLTARVVGIALDFNY
jgi:iron complex outermembrane receptor protein